ACVITNIRGARVVGGSSLVMLALLLGPFVVLIVGAFMSQSVPSGEAQPLAIDFVAGILVAMFNYMGWDNASTIAGEVDRPQRTYPLAMLATVTLVALTYLLPVAAVSRAGLDASAWTTGSWVEAAAALGGRGLGAALV